MATSNPPRHNSDIVCPVCLDLFSLTEKIPKGLICHHTICLPCARKLFHNGKIECPICRNKHKLKNVDKLFTHHHVMSMVQEHERKVEQQQQRDIREHIEPALDSIREDRQTLTRKLAVSEDIGNKLKKSASKAITIITYTIDLLIKKLQERKKKLIEEVNKANDKLRDQLITEAQSNHDETTKLLEERQKLLRQSEITADEHAHFVTKQQSVHAIAKEQDNQFQEMEVIFDERMLLSDVNSFGYICIPKLKPLTTIIPRYVKQLVAVRTLGFKGSDRGHYYNPTGVAVTREGDLLVADKGNHRLQKLDNEGHVIQVIGSKGNKDGQFNCPTGVAIDDNGRIYVADQLNNRIQVLDETGKHLSQFGHRGSGAGQFENPTSVAIDQCSQLIYATDYFNNRIQVFDLNGAYQRHIGDASELTKPYGIAIRGNRIYVSDKDAHCIVVYTLDGQKVKVIGKQGSGRNEFNCPTKMTTDSYGRIWICDGNNDQIKIVDPQKAEVISVFGSQGTDPVQLNGPIALSLTSSGQLVVVEYGAHRVQIFDLK